MLNTNLFFFSFNLFRSSSAELHRRQQILQQQQQQAQRQMPSMVHQRPAHSQSHQSLSSLYDNSGIRGYKVIQDVQPMSHSLQQPFKKTHFAIQDITVPCVNMNPYSDSELLISIVDFNELLFPKLDFNVCVDHLTVLKIQQYIGNR